MEDKRVQQFIDQLIQPPMDGDLFADEPYPETPQYVFLSASGIMGPRMLGWEAIADVAADEPGSKFEAEQQPVNSPSREEIDAKFETMEVRMDGRVASIESKIDGFIGRMDERGLRSDDRFDRSEQRMAGIEASAKETQGLIGSLKTTMIVTALSTVIAIVLGVAAFNATLLSNMVASFESGKNTAVMQSELKRQVEETAAILRQMQAKLDAAPQQQAPARDVKK